MTEDEWKVNIGQRLTLSLPSNTLASAIVLADAWLTDNGGWNGTTGHPSGGETDDAVVTAITAAQLARTLTTTATVNLSFRIALVGSFADGATTDTILGALGPAGVQRMTDIFNRQDGAEFVGVDWESGSVTTKASGTLSDSDMQATQAAIELADGAITDPAAIATVSARTQYSLDSTWMCDSTYTRGNGTEPVVATVRKYINTDYSSLDEISYKFVVRIGRTSGIVETITKVEQ